MGLAIGIILIASSMLLLGACIGRWTAPNRGPRKAEIKRAKEALAELDRIIAGGSLELQMLGSTVASEAGDVLRKYWRGE